ncbi:class I adenylate-forming enzyme family protein [Microbacterium invictum]|uniref:Acyl-CoA synthetase (AMP-forming)/AMP-acid ligase II n=1 Tax=Microbacterium invictum TaxID=515415 RepID=A0AA40VM40_9MICO|nr:MULTISPECIES: long-chain fatty acid--CoA ligase [Microbacterium]MBB4140011.1 acyl-CoA synthetase (AMP-forming)/AMP-acid ligase II [Microbacterium invictum]
MTITTLEPVEPLDPLEPVEQELQHAHVVTGHGAESAEWNVAGFLAGRGHDASTAWVDGHRRFTHAELRGAATAIADALRERGIQRGDPVALLAGNGFFWVAAYLGILGAGMIAVPLSTDDDATEARRRAGWAGCRAVTLGQGQRWPTGDTAVPSLAEVDLPVGWDRTPAPSLDAAPVRAGADAVYVFTPGTLGQPRAVRITHDNIRANTESILDCLYLESSDRTLAVVPFTEAFGASLLHTHLRIGAALVRHQSTTIPETIVGSLERFNCTGFAGAPTVYSALVRNSSFTLRRLPQLRMLQQAGRSLAPVIDEEVARAHPSARLFVMYGQTEATATLSHLPVEERGRRAASIGRGIPGVRLRVVDAGGADVRTGDVGEIWATGGNISPGYLHDDIATARTMQGGVLRTGDLATVDDDGYIYLVDRPALHPR